MNISVLSSFLIKKIMPRRKTKSQSMFWCPKITGHVLKHTSLTFKLHNN